MPSYSVASQMFPLGFQCFGLRTAASEAPLFILKPSESPKEDSQAPLQVVTIVIWAGERALEACEPLAPPKSAFWVAAPLHPVCQCRDARGWHARDTCAVTRDRGFCTACSLLPSHRSVLGWEKGVCPGKSTIFSMSCVGSQRDFSKRFTAGPGAGCGSGMQPCVFMAGAEEGGTS